ncbi:MAG: adenosylcobinamide-phosphate synthase CbiB [Pseudomonadota bacterium]
MILVTAMVLDAIIGDPKWLWSRLPHPVAIIGRVISAADRIFNRGAFRRLKGTFLVLFLVVAAGSIGLLPKLYPNGWIIELALATILIAQRSLTTHLKAVADALEISLDMGRHAVSMIVGRETADMNKTSISRAAIESGAENLSDGVIAPIFWFLVAGLPGLLIYKAVNTADSMIGYRTPKYYAFGWSAARLDDALNFIPARLTAFLIAGLHGAIANWVDIASDAKRHRSPNAGWPEAAMARALDVSLSGPRSYDGELIEFPFVHEGGRRSPNTETIRDSILVLWKIWAVCFFISLVFGATTIMIAGSFL